MVGLEYLSIAYLVLILMGVVSFIYCILYESKLIRIEWDAISRFLAFMTLVVFVRWSIMSLLMSNGDVLSHNVDTNSIQLYQLATVFWEDMAFALPFVFLKRLPYVGNKYVWSVLFLVSSVLFALGHTYQGNTWATITVIYPWYVSYRYGMKYGFGTVMICHMLYDFITICASRIAPLFI